MGINYNPRIVTDGLTICLDAGNIKSYPGSGTAWNDLSGRNNNFLLTNGPVFSTSNGGYFTFDGVNDDSSLATWAWPATMSLCFFISFISSSGLYNRIMSTQGDVFEIGISSAGSVSYYTPTNSWVNNVTTLSTNEWTFLAFSQSGTSVSIYKNGAVSYTGNLTTTTGSNYLIIGRRHNESEPTNIRLANFAVYDRTLSASEIQQNFNSLRGRYRI